jgi:hypothetical protein
LELQERIEAYEERERKEWFRTAWMTAEIISYLIGERVEISDLLPEMFPPKVWTKEEVKRELDEIKKELKIK